MPTFNLISFELFEYATVNLFYYCCRCLFFSQSVSPFYSISLWTTIHSCLLLITQTINRGTELICWGLFQVFFYLNSSPAMSEEEEETKYNRNEWFWAVRRWKSWSADNIEDLNSNPPLMVENVIKSLILIREYCFHCSQFYVIKWNFGFRNWFVTRKLCLKIGWKRDVMRR